MAIPAVQRAKLVLLTGGACFVAGVITVGAILPAEFNIDPLGLGRLTGLDRLWSPEQVVYKPPSGGLSAPPFVEATRPYRQDLVMIPIPHEPFFRTDLEYKVRAAAGARITFSWTASPLGHPDALQFEFHGHTLDNGQELTVASYEIGAAAASAGSLTVPFDGVHGWYFKNQSDADIVVALHISGFYELIPPGEVGNLAYIIANVPADRAVQLE